MNLYLHGVIATNEMMAKLLSTLYDLGGWNSIAKYTKKACNNSRHNHHCRKHSWKFVM